MSAAASLPQCESAARGTFANSMHFDSESRTLWLRRERLETVGELIDVLLHGVAHVTVSDAF